MPFGTGRTLENPEEMYEVTWRTCKHQIEPGSLSHKEPASCTTVLLTNCKLSGISLLIFVVVAENEAAQHQIFPQSLPLFQPTGETVWQDLKANYPGIPANFLHPPHCRDRLEVHSLIYSLSLNQCTKRRLSPSVIPRLLLILGAQIVPCFQPLP